MAAAALYRETANWTWIPMQELQVELEAPVVPPTENWEDWAAAFTETFFLVFSSNLFVINVNIIVFC